ncbi:hypothetical protein ASPZODRAFT_129205 [Penicilliopsis zonata CBS 506.65]|uniref:Uncharacterized protein n=1 Tax=Penicilliopsis zonata CBS 506.65 TaxID=1073090 RepID=A0A1L9SP89_9EURO|nr:hypothetical protein ASPZODRAFT_129205 [Penicilliopsis zonata CBS 506.65]OJJ48874.1 hypothetical protein ASPZODRAFT_129205 [Penicilliopsis zonata CBS 506.65]
MSRGNSSSTVESEQAVILSTAESALQSHEPPMAATSLESPTQLQVGDSRRLSASSETTANINLPVDSVDSVDSVQISQQETATEQGSSTTTSSTHEKKPSCKQQ